MSGKFKIGILRETKTPPDRRVALPPMQALALMRQFPNIEIAIQPSELRCYKDIEYTKVGLSLQEDLSDCDILLGVKEVKAEALIPGKTYLFFAHVAKKQPHNQRLLQTIVRRKITLIDYEYLTDIKGVRLVAFGRWAGIVGAYNALRARGLRTDYFTLKPAHHCCSKEEMFDLLKTIKLRPIKILVTGGGRVAMGAMETFGALGVREVSPTDFLTMEYSEAVLTRIEASHYVKRKDGEPFDMAHFKANPTDYESTFLPYTKVTDLFVACHYWDYRSPHFFSANDMLSSDFKISVIADVSCDVPGPIPATVRTSSIAEPFYGYNRFTGKEEVAFTKAHDITIMAVDNLPGELPRDAAADFGEALVNKVLPCFLNNDPDGVLQRATITQCGVLTPRYEYLTDFATGQPEPFIRSKGEPQ